MTVNNVKEIDFAGIEGPVYTGRERGERLRKKFHLDEVDNSDAVVKISIPENTYSISSSFFLGLFGPSIVKYKTREAFLEKYRFHTTKFLMGVVDQHIARALQERSLFS
jgi:hypothetical protein